MESQKSNTKKTARRRTSKSAISNNKDYFQVPGAEVGTESTQKSDVQSKGVSTGGSSGTPVLALEAPSKTGRRPLMAVGFMIHAITSQYKILSLLGSGGFGDVYEVEQMSTGNKYALKTEDGRIDKRLSRLKMEALLLELCGAAKSKQHFLTLIEKGRIGNFKFIIMPIVGQAIDKVRRDTLSGNQFSKYSAWNVSLQMMEAVRDLHSIYYLHRDLKPQNFAIGKSDPTAVYMLDFGIARKCVDSKGKLLVPRCKVKFMGTIRYAPRAGHRQMDQSRKDDLEAMCYVIADVYHEYSITWRGKTDAQELLKYKDGFMRNIGVEITTVYEMELLPQMMKKLCQFINDINPASLVIDYEAILAIIKEAEPPKEELDWLNQPLIEKFAKEKADRLAKAGTKVAIK